MSQVEMWPPGGGTSILANPGQVENYERAGWTRDKPAPRKRATKSQAETASGSLKTED